MKPESFWYCYHQQSNELGKRHFLTKKGCACNSKRLQLADVPELLQVVPEKQNAVVIYQG